MGVAKCESMVGREKGVKKTDLFRGSKKNRKEKINSSLSVPTAVTLSNK
jgi:hypothetical protein